MDNYKEVLEYLIELKKTKKEPNKIEKDQFAEAWQYMVAAEGYSEDADAFLYNGFTYCGASVVKQYIKNSDNPVEAIRKVFSGNMYGKSCASTVPVLFHLFTVLMNEKQPDLSLISEIIKRIPSALKNKEGKIYGQADRAFKKYILDDLRCDVLPSFAEFVNGGLKLAFVRDFIRSVDEILNGMKTEGFSKKCLKNIQTIQIWLHPAEMKKVVSGKKDTKAQEILKDAAQEQISNPDETASNLSEEEIYKKKLEEALKQQDGLKIELEESNALVASLKQQLSEATAEKTRLSEIVDAREAKILALSGDLSFAKINLKEHQQQIERMSKELQERTVMIEALSRDRAKQSDEAFNRLASKLRIEYRDFMDAVGIPMDSNLGENMREQLKNVFNILIKAGISID